MAKTSPATPTETAATILSVPVEQLRESPFNPRKRYSEAALRELSMSIASQGMLQPIVARPLPQAAQDIWVRYEIVFGHRRYRAALMVDDMTTVPVVLREFTDHQAALAQVAENLQRQDVSPLEEADSFIRLHTHHGMTADQIAAGVAKSRSYVYGRLKLAKVAPEVREAIDTDGLPVDIAIEVARLAEPALQKKALKDLKSWAYDDAWPSVRTAQQRLRGMFDNDVDKAVFDPADATLAKLPGPCTTCPKRAGNDPDLNGVLDAGVCTDRMCFEGKAREHNRLELVTMAALGHPVVQRHEADEMLPNPHGTPKGYVAICAGNWVGGKHVTYSDMLAQLTARGGPVPKETLVAANRGTEIRSFLTDAQAAEVLLAFGGKEDDGDDGASTPSTAGAGFRLGAGGAPADLADWTPAELVVRGDGWMRVKEAVLRNLLVRPRTADDMRAILLREYDQADGFGPISKTMGLDAEQNAAEQAFGDQNPDGYFSYRAWWEARLATLSPDQLAALMLGAALWDLLGYGGATKRESAARQVALAERYGVDVVAAARPEQMDDAGAAGSPGAKAGAQIDAFGAVPA